MAGKDENEHHLAFIKRIIATLLSLAALVERLPFYPRPVRKFVLWMLRPAEKIARRVVFAEACAAGLRHLPEIIFSQPCRNGFAEVERLAQCFRVMARWLQWIYGLGDAPVEFCWRRLSRQGQWSDTGSNAKARLRLLKRFARNAPVKVAAIDSS